MTSFSLNLNLLNSQSALQPTSVRRCRFLTAGRQWRRGEGRASLKMQLPRTRVSLGRFSRWPLRTMEWLSSQKRKLIWFSLVILLRASRMRYSSKQTWSPSVSWTGLSSMVQSSPKLYFTCTRYASPFTNTSLLSTQLSSNSMASRYSSLPNSTCEYSTPKDAAIAAMKSEGYFRPISTISLSWWAGNELIDTDRLQLRRNSFLVGLVDSTDEWLKATRTGSLVMRSQSNTQVRGMRITPPDPVLQTATTRSNSQQTACIFISFQSRITLQSHPAC